MRPVKLLPDNYLLRGEVNLAKDRKLLIGFLLGGGVLFFVAGLFFMKTLLAPRFPTQGSISLGWTGLLGVLVVLLIVTVLVMVLHELSHGLFYWIFTRELPVFSFKGLYAYAAAPNWYIPRLQFLIVGIAPLILLTIFGVALVPLISPAMIAVVVYALTINTAGAIGDLYLIFRLLFMPSTCLIHDVGDSVAWYVSTK